MYHSQESKRKTASKETDKELIMTTENIPMVYFYSTNVSLLVWKRLKRLLMFINLHFRLIIWMAHCSVFFSPNEDEII